MKPLMKPLVGITGRRLPSSSLHSIEERYTYTEVDMFFADFPHWVDHAGGIPVSLPYEAANSQIVERLNGLVLTGGQDVHPDRWGGSMDDIVGDLDTARDHYEIELALVAIEQQLPVLAVCRGAQVLNVALGGTLIGDLLKDPIDHVSTGLPVETLHHEVEFAEGSLARGLYGPKRLVNSLHHQSVDKCGEGLVVTGRASDGTVETLEMPGAPVLAVQWHPEWMKEEDPAFQWLVNTVLDRAAGIDVSV